jgi:beta-N-acetylhexosaminidase
MNGHVDTSDDELVGAVLCTGIPGPWLDRETRRALEDVRPGGIILFRRNCEDVAQLRALTAQLHALPSAPLVSIDHEGGAVMRLGEPFTHFPPARTMSLPDDPEIAYAVGKAMATELATVGIDLSYAPVLDVDSNRDNPIIGKRAFGADPETVVRFALPFMRGLLDGGVIPCGKHFPGHGDTDRDSHLELPVVRRSREDLTRTELAPFRAAIAADIPALMTAHVLYPAFDPSVPASVSRTILQQLLRREMGFTGVIVSDDLEMQALRTVGSVADCAVRSLQAGVDCVLVCNDFEEALRTADRLRHAWRDGTLDRTALERSAARIRALRPRKVPTDVSLPVRAHQELNERLRRYASTAAEQRIG